MSNDDAIMNDTNSSAPEEYSVPWIFSFVAYWELMVAVIGTPMNLFVIFIWSTVSFRSTNRRFTVQSRNRWFILSMACGDLLFTSVHAPMMYMWYGGNIEMTTAPCYITYGATHLSTTVSSMNLLLLNVDKFIYLHWPLHYHSMITKKRAIALTVGAWLVSVTWMFIFLFGPFLKRDEHCIWKPQHQEFYLVFLLVFFLMPILLSTATSVYIAIVAVKASLKEAASQAIYGNGNNSVCDMSKTSTVSNEFSPAKLNGHRMTLSSTSSTVRPWRTITFVFTTTIWSTITYLPYRISFVISSITGKTAATWYFPLLALMVIYAAGNPFITILTQPAYRRRVLDIFKALGFGKLESRFSSQTTQAN